MGIAFDTRMNTQCPEDFMNTTLIYFPKVAISVSVFQVRYQAALHPGLPLALSNVRSGFIFKGNKDKDAAGGRQGKNVTNTNFEKCLQLPFRLGMMSF
jgi:hypothetical protein